VTGTWPTIGALLSVGLLLAATLVSISTPRAAERPGSLRSGGLRSDGFRIDLAMAHVRAIAARPHPTGSEANHEVREYLLAQLAELGLVPVLDSRTVLKMPRTGLPVLARVQNISASLAGDPALRAVLLMAHYDSVATAPGAADDAAGVATVLEVARALVSEGEPRGELHVLLTDGEELGLFGAHAAVGQWRIDPETTVVLNFEARGMTGPAVMFETGPSGRAVRYLAAARRPIATSVAAEVYRRLPNNTDFSEVSEAGYDGLNFALIRGSAYYHTAGDEPARLSPASLAHLGATALSASRRAFADRPRPQVMPADRQRTRTNTVQTGTVPTNAVQTGTVPTNTVLTGTVHFPILGRLVRYPHRASAALTALTVLAYLAVAGVAASAGVSLPRAGLSTLGGLGLVAGAALLGIAGWRLARAVRPELASFEFGDSYRSGWYSAGLLAVTAAGVLLGGIGLHAMAGQAAFALGCWALLVLLAVLCAVLAPGAGYLFGWPPLLATVVLLAGVRGNELSEGSWLPAWTISAWACVLLFVPIVALLLPTNGLAGLAAPSALTTLPVLVGYGTALPVLGGGRGPFVAAGLFAVGLLLLAVGLAVDRIDAEHPQHTGLCYLRDERTGHAWWLSPDRRPPAWTRRFAGAERVSRDDRWLGPALAATVSMAPAPAAELAALRWDCEQEPDGAGRRLLLRLWPSVPGGALWLRCADRSGDRLAELVVDGVRVPVDREPVGFGFWAVPAEGIEVRLRLTDGQPLELELAAHCDGLPAELLRPPMPAELTWSPTYTRVTVLRRRIIV
jgi:Peptidase family M28